ncbi:peptide-methionine (R)-S-oxide reductase MsrB [Pajaroellobacter abortibovis]|uniref:peptide-methionine (R)-S-oxide reductase n=1 Tax=Pajaroellobacter abortibovis TaxID=1882918 RepID=A0A1L6MX49_9BACT|nr:peptide-methionine (R)-S-oxide reductase MsrB [Pajaroellobacter abortibovis]APR99987.1 peptide-methionine (R)-S-oxide reductase [Pajaroellobacter abortibovis]
MKRVDQIEKKWEMELTPIQFKVCHQKGTEAPFTGEYWNLKACGIYQCVCCRTNLFHSDAKFDSGTGWPSFFEPINEASVAFVEDISHGMIRLEVQCAQCGAHLGHRFEDGPTPTGERYCIISTSLHFLAL